MTAREWALWALRHWAFNYRDELVGVTVTHIAKMSALSRQSVHKALVRLEREGLATRNRTGTQVWYPAAPEQRRVNVLFPDDAS